MGVSVALESLLETGPGRWGSVNYGQDGTRVYVKDESLIEPFGTDHNGTNTGSEPVRIRAVFVGSDAIKNTVMEK